MVQWYHLIISAYGFWLPNDPRGSWSDFVGSWEILKFGKATTVHDGRNYAGDPHDHKARRLAKSALKYPAVRFDAPARSAIATGFGLAVDEAGYEIHACCIGYDHAHLVCARHERPIETVSRHLKSKASMAMKAKDCHPLAPFNRDGTIPTPWAEGEWKVFINEPEQLRSAIAYVKHHPMKEGLPPQSWPFIPKT